MAYNRTNALIYATGFWGRVCHDGLVATKRGNLRKINGVHLKPGMAFSAVGAVDGEEDCTHFLSCCLGNHSEIIDFEGTKVKVSGGGLTIRQPFKNEGLFGQSEVSLLCGSWGDLIVRNHAKYVGRKGINAGERFWPIMDPNTREAIKNSLRPGDVLAYSSRASLTSYEHAAILVGPINIACHSRNRCGQDFTDVPHAWVTLLKLP
jgi:hypothetical protein